MKPSEPLIFRPIPPSVMQSPLARTIRQLGISDYANGPWIAGGCVISLACERGSLNDVGDIDVFLRTIPTQDVDAVRMRLHKITGVRGSSQYRKSTTLYQFYPFHEPDCTGEKAKVQLIEFKRYASLRDVLTDFDFTVAQFATDGHTICGTEAAWNDVTDRVLRATIMNRKTLGRISKYCEMGFTPTPELLLKTVDATVKKKHYSDGMTVYSDGNY